MSDLLPQLLLGAWTTLYITVIAAALALVLGVLAGLGKLSRIWPVRALAVVYVEVFRGTSALVQLFWLFFVLPFFGVSLPPLAVAVLGLGLNIGAYGAEVVRGAVLSISAGQHDAARALNFTRRQALWRIVLPQAVLTMIPTWGNLFIELLKATALVSLITISDLTFKAVQLNQTTFRTGEIFGTVFLLYLAMALAITLAMRQAERLLGRYRPAASAT